MSHIDCQKILAIFLVRTYTVMILTLRFMQDTDIHMVMNWVPRRLFCFSHRKKYLQPPNVQVSIYYAVLTPVSTGDRTSCGGSKNKYEKPLDIFREYAIV